jgi:hypothetical protein
LVFRNSGSSASAAKLFDLLSPNIYADTHSDTNSDADGHTHSDTNNDANPNCDNDSDTNSYGNDDADSSSLHAT